MKALRNNPEKAQRTKKLSKNSRMMNTHAGDLNAISRSGASAAGKGDGNRIGDKESFDDNYDGINWNSKGVA